MSADKSPSGKAIPLPLAMLLVLLAMASIQTGAAVAKQLFPMVGAIGATALRATLSALMLCAFWRPWRDLPKSAAAWKPILWYGLALGVMNLSFYLALARVPLGVAVTLEFTGPLGLALLGSRRRLDLVWGLLAVAGVALLMPLGAFATALDPVGVAFALTAGICWALYIVAGKRAGSGSHSGITAALGLSVAALVALPPGLATAGAKFLTPEIWPFALAIALFSSALPYSLEMIALKRLPARSFGILMSLGPAFAALSGLLILHERLGPNQWLAIALVVVASLGSTLTTRDAS